MTWAPFLVSNLPRIASVRAAFDRRRLLTVNPSCALFCDLLPSPGTGARLKRVGQAMNKSFCVRSKTDQKRGAPMSHGSDSKPRIHSRTFPTAESRSLSPQKQAWHGHRAVLQLILTAARWPSTTLPVLTYRALFLRIRRNRSLPQVEYETRRSPLSLMLADHPTSQ